MEKNINLLSMICFIFIAVACNSKSVTSSSPPVINEIDSSMMLFKVVNDGMDRGNHDYQGEVVIDPNNYSENSIQRGDVVYFQKENKHDIARVIGLPGEEIKIENGQIYVNGEKLNEFYGYENRYGKKVNESDVNFSIKVSENAYYLMADNWYRWGILEQSTPKEKILGKVIGVKK